MTEASGNVTHPEQRANPVPRTTRPAIGVARLQSLPNAYPAFCVPAQEGYATSYDAVTALEEEHSQVNMKNVIWRDLFLTESHTKQLIIPFIIAACSHLMTIKCFTQNIFITPGVGTDASCNILSEFAYVKFITVPCYNHSSKCTRLHITH